MQEWKLWKMKVVQVKVEEIWASVTRKSKIGSHKSACEYSCFNGKGAHGSLKNNNKKARVNYERY